MRQKWRQAKVHAAIFGDGLNMGTDQAFGFQLWLAYAIRNSDQVWLYELEGIHQMMSLGLHLRIIWALEEFFRHMRKHDGMWVAARHQIPQTLAAVDPA